MVNKSTTTNHEYHGRPLNQNILKYGNNSTLKIYSRTSLNRTPRDRPKLVGLTDFRFIRFIYKAHIETGTSDTVRFKR